jgi:molybdate transport system substrate-binding protein
VAVAVALSLAIGGGVARAASGASSKVRGTTTVLAAASLTEAYIVLGERFEKKYPDATVELSFGSSATLVTQVQMGAPADVIATADTSNIERLVDTGQVEESAPIVFARNKLAIAVADGNPKKIKGLADTLDPDVTLVLCAPEAPCGKYALEAYDNAGLPAPAVPTGANAKDTLAKVELGEADAAVVYVTDVRAATGDVVGVGVAPAENVIAIYAIAPIVGAPNPVGAKAFSVFVQSKASQKVLRRFGFLEP